jgi:hypothetical protein
LKPRIDDISVRARSEAVAFNPDCFTASSSKPQR